MIYSTRIERKGISIISLQQTIIVNQKEEEEFLKKYNDLVSCYDLSDITKK